MGLGVMNAATTASANPLGRWIRPGMTVVVKPNWVKHEFGATVGRNVLFTHASLVRQSGLAELEKDYARREMTAII